MKVTTYIIKTGKVLCILLCVLTIISCKKDGFSTVPLSSLKIINTVSGGMDAKLRSAPSATIWNNYYADFGVLPGNQDLYVYPVSDSIHPYYHANNKVVLDAQQTYSLFLGGIPSKVSSVLVHEKWDRPKTNIYIRFVNFSPAGSAISINLRTSPNIEEFSNVEFGKVTEFKGYAKGGSSPSYLFEVRDIISKNLIAEFDVNTFLVGRFNHLSFVLQSDGLVFIDHN